MGRRVHFEGKVKKIKEGKWKEESWNVFHLRKINQSKMFYIKYKNNIYMIYNIYAFNNS